MRKRFFLFLLIAAQLSGACAPFAAAEPALSIRKVDNLPEDFILGMDVSSVIAEEKSGVKYYNEEGKETDLFRILADAGINTIRVRVWNDPYDGEGHGFGGGNCDIATAVEIGKRAAACGLKLIVDFHYSDFWADPGKQMVPRAWRGMRIGRKADAAYEYTRECLLMLKEAGVDVRMVQLGNETNGKMAGESSWDNIARLMQAGAKAVREIYPGALIAVHFTDPQNRDAFLDYAKTMAAYEKEGKVDYDVFATSYYPFWHGTLDDLSAVMTEAARITGKQVMVMETSYPWTGEDSDFSGNTAGEDSVFSKPYPFSVQGQANSVRDVTDTVVNRMPGGIGVVYWEGAWITVGGHSREENSALWEKYGSGWATSYAAVYDPDDAGQYYGGSAVDNQAFFDPQGHPLASLKVFRMMRDGGGEEARIDSLVNPEVACGPAEQPVLPATVTAVMTDNSRKEVPVSWRLTEEQERQMREGGAGTYEIAGEAEGLPVKCRVTVEARNYLRDGGFEEGGTGWTVKETGHADELFVEDKQVDSLSGTKHLHFWSAKENSIEFTAEQAVPAGELPGGRYRFTVSIMGGDGGDTEIYAYVKIDGKTAGTAPMKITSWKNWDTEAVEFDHPAGSEVTVGVYVRCQGKGKGAWGKIDDASLVRIP